MRYPRVSFVLNGRRRSRGECETDVTPFEPFSPQFLCFFLLKESNRVSVVGEWKVSDKFVFIIVIILL